MSVSDRAGAMSWASRVAARHDQHAASLVASVWQGLQGEEDTCRLRFIDSYLALASLHWPKIT